MHTASAPVALHGAPGVLADGLGGSAHQAASGVLSAVRARVGRLLTHRRSSSISMTVALPAFRAVRVPSRIASKIRVRLTPVLFAASSGLNPSRGTWLVGWDSMMHLLRSAECRRVQSDTPRSGGCNPGFL